MTELEEDGDEGVEELELLELLELSPSFSCPRTSTDTIEAGDGAAGGDCSAFQSRPSRSAAFHEAGGVAPGPERR